MDPEALSSRGFGYAKDGLVEGEIAGVSIISCRVEIGCCTCIQHAVNKRTTCEKGLLQHHTCDSIRMKLKVEALLLSRNLCAPCAV